MNENEVAAGFFQSECSSLKKNEILRWNHLVVYRDSLTEIQAKIIGAVFACHNKEQNPTGEYSVSASALLGLSPISDEEKEAWLLAELGKVLKKGVVLYEKTEQSMCYTLWFQKIEWRKAQITFQFTEKMLPLILQVSLESKESEFARKLQYKGKHTLAVFQIIWPEQSKGVVELTIQELMRRLQLENTRYSYGQLRLRVLEPAFEEIYAWDSAIFVRFGPTFSGRRVAGVWFEVITGEKAVKLRQEKPAFSVLLPEEKMQQL